MWTPVPSAYVCWFGRVVQRLRLCGPLSDHMDFCSFIHPWEFLTHPVRILIYPSKASRVMMLSASAFEVVVVVRSVLSEDELSGRVFEELVPVLFCDELLVLVVSGVVIDYRRTPRAPYFLACPQSRASEREEYTFWQTPHEYWIPYTFLPDRFFQSSLETGFGVVRDRLTPAPAVEPDSRTPVVGVSDESSSDVSDVNIPASNIKVAHRSGAPVLCIVPC